ncbi:hypothetical protein PHET_11652 [Paragonimus heterotremus]|uniref:Yippee domain-containing protein n=1 Tax=Paragonimus heterotremus TaxID=100268 RepID=A0A8J4WSB9_9TREM|nr:hypothetical protein PHET_11652 [Paragonimus heterotremus]
MGWIFIEHLGGDKVFNCKTCGIPLSNDKELDRFMMTGRHLVRDVKCIKCNTKLGWIYEHAVENTEMYKEGRVILEEALFVESDGIADPLGERSGSF